MTRLTFSRLHMAEKRTLKAPHDTVQYSIKVINLHRGSYHRHPSSHHSRAPPLPHKCTKIHARTLRLARQHTSNFPPFLLVKKNNQPLKTNHRGRPAPPNRNEKPHITSNSTPVASFPKIFFHLSAQRNLRSRR